MRATAVKSCNFQEKQQELMVCVVEKGSEVGAHILSGSIRNPGIDELFPDWKEKGAPITTAVTEDHIYYLTSETGGHKIPNIRRPTPCKQGAIILSAWNVSLVKEQGRQEKKILDFRTEIALMKRVMWRALFLMT